MTEILLFSYGTLRLAEVQRALFGRLVEGESDAMPGYRQRMIEISDPDVIAKSGTRWHPMGRAERRPRGCGGRDAVSPDGDGCRQRRRL